MSKVRFITARRKVEISDFVEAFQFRPERRLPWLQRACFYVLRKLRAYYADTKINFDRIAIDEEKFIDNVFKQQHELVRAFGKTPKRILMGAADYRKLMGELHSPDHHFAFNSGYYVNDYRGRETFIGLEVEVVPWMEGVIVMPARIKTV